MTLISELDLLVIVGSFWPAFLFLLVAHCWRWRDKAVGVRRPMTDRLLRPPGESVRLKLLDLDERLITWLFTLIFVSFFLGQKVINEFKRRPSLANPTVIILVCVQGVGSCLLIGRLLFLLNKRWNYDLGFSGERAVGEELNKLMLDGCQVFHDFPADPKWNIDHIVVAPSGVYAIETKTRRKRRARPGQKDHEIIYDGKTLQFPHGSDAYGLEQVRLNAAWLSRFLGQAIGEPVRVEPILTLPGWFITSRVNADLKVLNPKQIRSVITGRPLTLNDQKAKQIIHQLEQKCRDVEF